MLSRNLRSTAAALKTSSWDLGQVLGRFALLGRNMGGGRGAGRWTGDCFNPQKTGASAFGCLGWAREAARLGRADAAVSHIRFVPNPPMTTIHYHPRHLLSTAGCVRERARQEDLERFSAASSMSRDQVVSFDATRKGSSGVRPAKRKRTTIAGDAALERVVSPCLAAA